MADEEHVQSAKGRITPRMVGGIVLAALAVAFILSNREQANVSFLIFDADLALWLVLTLTFAVGLAVGTLVLGRSRYKPSKKG